MPLSIPILVIPGTVLLALAAHMTSSIILVSNRCLDTSNPNGSATLERAKKKLTPRLYGRYERSKNCSRNHVEHMPLFFATILAGLIAERESGTDLGLTTYALTFFAIRMLYTVNYIVVETTFWSYLRTALFGAGLTVTFGFLWRLAEFFG